MPPDLLQCGHKVARQRLQRPGPGRHLLGGADVRERTCSEGDCQRKPKARGFCEPHYLRRWRQGTLPPIILPAPDPDEQWRPVVGYEGLYEVSDHGQVRRSGTGGGAVPGRILRGNLSNGRRSVCLSRDDEARYFRVHALVAKAFIGPRPDGHECNHKDGDKHNNHADNLEWVTPAANKEHARQHGMVTPPQQGEASRQAKLTDAAVIEIRALRGSLSQRQIAARYGISQQRVSNILRGQGWRHLAPDPAGLVAAALAKAGGS